MNKTKTWDFAFSQEPLVPIGNYIPAKRRRRDNRPMKNLDHSTPLDHQRVAREKLEHCPHGVPKTQLCAICDPEKFHDRTGGE